MQVGQAVRRALALGLLATCLPVAPADAGRMTTVTIRAPRSGYVERTFTSAVTLHDEPSTVTLDGTYAGYYVQPLGGSPVRGYGHVWFAAFRTPGFDHYDVRLGNVMAPWWDGKLKHRLVTLPAGRYRFHVFGDRPAIARLRFSGNVRATTLTATKSSRVYAAAKDLATVPGAASPTVVADLPLPTEADALSFASLFDVTRDLPVGLGEPRKTCLGRPADLRCATAPRESTGWWTREFRTTLVHATASTWTTYYHRDALPRGENYGYFEAVLTPPVEKVIVAVFTLALS